MEIGNFSVVVESINNDSNRRHITIFYDLMDKVFYKLKKHNSTEECLVVYSLADMKDLRNIDGYPNQFAKHLLDNTSCTYSFEVRSFDLQQKKNVCILSEEYVNQEVKDAWVYGLKRSITDLEKYKVFRTIQEFDDFIKKEFNTYRNLTLTVKTTNNEASFTKSNETKKGTQTTQNTSINTYDTVKQCVDEVNDYVKSMLNKTIDNKIQLNSYNLLEKAVEYCNSQLGYTEEHDIIETIKSMLSSGQYVLSDDFKKNKLDLKDIRFKFKMLTSSKSITQNEILVEVFDIDNSVSFI